MQVYNHCLPESLVMRFAELPNDCAFFCVVKPDDYSDDFYVADCEPLLEKISDTTYRYFEKESDPQRFMNPGSNVISKSKLDAWYATLGQGVYER